MRRREFLGLVGAAAAWPFAARAQQRARVPTIGFIGSDTAAAQKRWTEAFVYRLRELGWVDGSTVIIEYRWAEGRSARAAEAAADFVRLNVDVIVTNGTTMILAVKKATSVIPIIFPVAGDPVGTGLVASLSRPGGNLTGLSALGTDLASKHLELLREVHPSFRRLAIIANPLAVNAMLQVAEMQEAARKLGLQVDVLEIRTAEDIAPAFHRMHPQSDALFVANEPLVVTHRLRINELARANRLPTIYAFREFVDAGGLMSYGPNFPNMFRRAADYVDKVLRGAKPANLPVEQPTKFELIVNLKTAKAIGLTIPDTFLARADEVIE